MALVLADSSLAVHRVAADGRFGDGFLRHPGYDSVLDVLDVLDWGVCCGPMLDVLHRFRCVLCLKLHPLFLISVLVDFLWRYVNEMCGLLSGMI